MKPRDLIFFLPFLIFSVFILQEDLSNYKLKLLIAENFLFSCCILAIYKIVSNKITFILGYFLLASKSFFHLFYTQKFGELPGASVVYVALETNFQEALEFFEATFNWGLIFLMLIFFLPLLFFIIVKTEVRRRNLWPVIISCFLIVFIYNRKNLFRYNIFGTSFAGIIEYRDFKVNLKTHELNGKIGHVSEISRKFKSEKREIHVLVIGESTTRHRMGLYGYSRENSPMLKSIRDQLYINENAISPHTYTIESLSQTLILEKKDTEERFSVIQMMNAAKFETYWISNQKPVGVFDSFITTIAAAADNQKFLNISGFNAQTPYDEVLIPEFKKVLESNQNDLFIVLHLMGTHSSYHRRYPKEFAKFTGEPPLTGYKGKGVYEMVNEYDNAILYNDFVIYNLIKELEKIDASAYLLYIADHGEDVYQINKSASHSVGEGTKPMYDIPFIFWASTDFLQNRDLNFDSQNPIYLKDLGHILSDLSELEFNDFKKEKSVFSYKYEMPNRIIFNNQNYDSLFLAK